LLRGVNGIAVKFEALFADGRERDEKKNFCTSIGAE
jgi:hypothetical protein